MHLPLVDASNSLVTGAQMPVPRDQNLSAQMLANAPPGMQKQMLGEKLYPAAGPERLLTLRNQAPGIGFLDVLLVRLHERNKPAERQTPEIVASNERKTRETADRLERDIALLTDRPYDISHVAIGTALAYLDFRFTGEDWRAGRPGLTAWHAGFLDRPAVRANPFADDS